ncbi:hypothetical protein BH11MYX1_BH11MYX1_20570 [soil metagenome]
MLARRLVNRLYRKLRSTGLYNRYMEARVSSLTSHVTGMAMARDATYVDYLKTQIDKSFRSTKATLRRPDVNERTKYLVEKMRPFLPEPRAHVQVLCVGCRNAGELDYIERTCGVKTRGLDLFSEDRRVEVGDMHKMPFSDGQFDAIYSCHSLEHSFDHAQVLAEYARVVRPGGVITIEVPVAFEKNETDYWDFQNAGGLVSAFGPRVARVLWSEDAANAGNAKKRVARVVVETAPA